MARTTLPTFDDAVAAVRDSASAAIAGFGGILEAFNDDAGFALLQAEREAVEALQRGIAMVEFHGQAFAVLQP